MQPPGRSTRKARDFEADIVQLRAQGYTLEAIRDALARAGVHVSVSTVRREANRRLEPHPAEAAAGGAISGVLAPSPSQAPAAAQAPTAAVSTPALPERRSGTEIAEAFIRNRITNPLIRSKEQRR